MHITSMTMHTCVQNVAHAMQHCQTSTKHTLTTCHQTNCNSTAFDMSPPCLFLRRHFKLQGKLRDESQIKNIVTTIFLFENWRRTHFPKSYPKRWTGVGWLWPMPRKTDVHAACCSHRHCQAALMRTNPLAGTSLTRTNLLQAVRSRQQGLAGCPFTTTPAFTATKPRRSHVHGNNPRVHGNNPRVHGNQASEDPRSRDNAPRTLGAGG